MRSRSWTASRTRSTARSPVPMEGCSPSPPTRRCSSCASCSPIGTSHRSSGGEREALQGCGRAGKLMLGRAGTFDEVAWHEVECGTYSADLPLWEELAEEHGGPVLELGCGTGRVALHLARRGHEVLGIDSEGELVEPLNARAGAAGRPAGAIDAGP